MNIWVIAVGDPLPTDENQLRPLRSGILVEYLVAAGHQVTWWSSTVDHAQKTLRAKRDVKIHVSNKLDLYLLHAKMYRRNISLDRLINHSTLGFKFLQLSKNMPKPDLIYCSFPTICLSAAAAKYGRKHQVPVVLDIRDLWPDIFVRALPKKLEPVAKASLLPLFSLTRYAFRHAAGIIGITDQFVDWGLRYAKRNRSERDHTFPLGYPDTVPNQESQNTAQQFWQNLGFGPDHPYQLIVFFGNMGQMIDFETIASAAKLLKGTQVRFLICGAGDRFEEFKKLAEGIDNLIMPGFINANHIWYALRIAYLGILPYFSTPDFKINAPNKFYEYLSAGLPILSCLQGEIEHRLKTHHCGIHYMERNPQSLVEAILGVVEDQSQQKTMAANALQLYQQKFRTQMIYPELINYFAKMAKVKPETLATA